MKRLTLTLIIFCALVGICVAIYCIVKYVTWYYIIMGAAGAALLVISSLIAEGLTYEPDDTPWNEDGWR